MLGSLPQVVAHGKGQGESAALPRLEVAQVESGRNAGGTSTGGFLTTVEESQTERGGNVPGQVDSGLGQSQGQLLCGVQEQGELLEVPSSPFGPRTPSGRRRVKDWLSLRRKSGQGNPQSPGSPKSIPSPLSSTGSCFEAYADTSSSSVNTGSINNNNINNNSSRKDEWSSLSGRRWGRRYSEEGARPGVGNPWRGGSGVLQPRSLGEQGSKEGHSQGSGRQRRQAARDRWRQAAAAVATTPAAAAAEAVPDSPSGTSAKESSSGASCDASKLKLKFFWLGLGPSRFRPGRGGQGGVIQRGQSAGEEELSSTLSTLLEEVATPAAPPPAQDSSTSAATAEAAAAAVVAGEGDTKEGLGVVAGEGGGQKGKGSSSVGQREGATESGSDPLKGLGQRKQGEQGQRVEMLGDSLAVVQEAAKILRAQVNKLQGALPGSHRQGFDDLYEALRRDVSALRHGSSAVAAMGCNRGKNRYCDVMPFDENRVALLGPSRTRDDGSDYINASYIDGNVPRQQGNKLSGSLSPEAPGEAGSEASAAAASGVVALPRYIATQGPLENTVADFWDMVLQNKCVAMLMLTREVEGNKLKCHHYFPRDKDTSEEFGHIRVTNVRVEEMEESVRARGRGSAAGGVKPKRGESLLSSSGRGGGLSRSGSLGPSTLRRFLQVEDRSRPKVCLELQHFEYLDWPDHGVPNSTSHIRQLIHFIRTSPDLSQGPIVVHCSAGIGRTGTYCTIDYSVRRVLQGDVSAVDIPAMISHLRSQRPGMVQTREQFRFCYLAVLEELSEILSDSSAL